MRSRVAVLFVLGALTVGTLMGCGKVDPTEQPATSVETEVKEKDTDTTKNTAEITEAEDDEADVTDSRTYDVNDPNCFAGFECKDEVKNASIFEDVIIQVGDTVLRGGMTYEEFVAEINNSVIPWEVHYEGVESNYLTIDPEGNGRYTGGGIFAMCLNNMRFITINFLPIDSSENTVYMKDTCLGGVQFYPNTAGYKGIYIPGGLCTDGTGVPVYSEVENYFRKLPKGAEASIYMSSQECSIGVYTDCITATYEFLYNDTMSDNSNGIYLHGLQYKFE